MAWKAGVWLVVALVLMRETYGPVILERKAARLRKSTGNSDLQVKGHERTPLLTHLGRGLMRPMKLLILSPVVLLLSIYVAFIFGLMFLCFSTYSAVFIEQYHFAVGVSGLTYLGQGIGMILGLVLFGGLSDRILKYVLFHVPTDFTCAWVLQKWSFFSEPACKLIMFIYCFEDSSYFEYLSEKVAFYCADRMTGLERRRIRGK